LSNQPKFQQAISQSFQPFTHKTTKFNTTMKKILSGAALLVSLSTIAQENKPSPITISGYAEAYYTYDFNKSNNNTRPAFLYSHNRTNEVNLNLGYIKAAYNAENVRANITLATGTYMNANYAAEPGLFKMVYEANAGVKLSPKANLWLDAGILPSHLGWESAVSKDCPTLTRSIAAENSPYFESGARLGYTSKNGKWYLSALILNGWQRIQRPDGNTTPAFGTQVTYKPNAAISLNSSTFIGNDKADSIKQMRYFHDFYGIFQISNSLSAILGFDIGAEQQYKGSSKLNTWYTPAAIVKYMVSSKTAIALRAEYYSDRDQVIIASSTPGGFKTWGFSANADYSIASNIVWRTELRSLNSKDDIFAKYKSDNINNNVSVTTSLAISF
jgi:putative OmpL-like beta-barrel porin-2